MDRIVVCVSCGEKKEHVAKGLCVICYGRHRYQENREKILEYTHHYRKAYPQRVRDTKRRCYEKNQKKNRIYGRRYYQEHIEEQREHSRAWYRNNREQARESHSLWMENNPGYMSGYQDKNREGINMYKRQWRRDNPGKNQTTVNRRRAHKQNVANTLTPKQLEFERKIGEATYLGEELHLHHLVPFSKGGGHTWGNIAFIPSSLNLSIQDKLPEEVYIQMGLGM